MICKELSKTLILGIYGHPNDKFVTFAGLMSTNKLIHVYIIHATSYTLELNTPQFSCLYSVYYHKLCSTL